MSRDLDEELKVRRFEGVFDGHRRAVLGYALRRVGRPEDAADVVAETFLVAWRRIDEVPDANTRAWLFGVARRVLANQRRGERRHNALAERLTATLEAEGRNVGAHRQPEPDPSPVMQALERLKPADREILQLSAWEEMEPTEIAVALDLNRVAVRSRLHRARRRLRTALDAIEADPGETGPARQPATSLSPLTEKRIP